MTNMQYVCVRFFVEEGMKHAHQPIHEWLFAEARVQGITGGTAFRAAAGYGRHGLHEDSFFELAGKLPETVEFFSEAERIEALIARVGAAGLKLLYVTQPVAVGMTGV
jgi:PII-like signaling protein